jgi:circadian clock protein KaiC
MSDREFAPHLTRFTSGIPGLDRVLDGGFLSGGVYIVEGAPGAGKTIFSNQVAFHQVQGGRHVLYVTLLAESHTRLLQHLQDMTFFDCTAIPDRLNYVSAFRALEEGGLKALLDLVRRELQARSTSMIVLDGFASAGESAANDREFKKFVNELQVHASLSSCTFFLLSSGLTDAASVQPVHTMVDGLVRLSDHTVGVRAQRQLQVQKLRGSRYLRGVHSFEISTEGVRVHPRLESVPGDAADVGPAERIETGLATLDALLGGGLRRGSSTMVLGPTGAGKSILGYSFLSRSVAAEKGLLFSFYETPNDAIHKAAGVGLDLAAQRKKGHLEIEWHSPVEASLDIIGERILAAVERVKARRLFVDGFNALEASTPYRERIPQFFGALSRALRGRGVTALYAAELQATLAPRLVVPVAGISPLLENLLVMHFREETGRLRRLLWVVKTRDSAIDSAILPFAITRKGIDIDVAAVQPPRKRNGRGARRRE